MHGFIPAARYLPYFTWPEVQALAARDDAVLIQPVGAIEQHGHHLPLATDSAIATGVLGAALYRLEPDVPVYALPPLYYGKSNEHIGFPGTVMLGAKTLLDTLMEIGESVYGWGVRRLVFFNAHGGQPQLMDIAARDLRARHRDFMTFPFFAWSVARGDTDLLTPRERAEGMHAGDAETSVMLALLGDRVLTAQAVAEYPPARGTRLTPEGALPYAWLTADLTRSGVIGDPTTASLDKGRRWLDLLGARWAEVFLDITRFELPASG
ncbi:creatininase family protein [Acidihalobacter ferrooxydans]|uniref:Creatinine amidohydrolase n=1 Tax=Acidihalobacter ferrooxydans TaxID=1765967 RepID=A0A1P8UGH8_9GAMM|nr:creatininase family protein [Acidihalobacter ferrooxydans]APZ42957.1 creatinine amidohydrolase [Acidihalobacter ferrooxydans]